MNAYIDFLLYCLDEVTGGRVPRHANSFTFR